MKRVLVIAFLITIPLFISAQATPTFRSDVNAEAEEEIKKLELLLASLLENGDLKTYAGYLTDDYIRISQNGMVATKEQVLKPMGGSGSFKMKPYDLSVRVYGNAAILNGKLEIERKNGDEIAKTSSLFTKVFIRKDGKWYLASLQGTPLK